MITRVGKQSNFIDAVKELIELDYDAVEAYETAINRLENLEYKDKLRDFQGDHKRHVKELSAFLTESGEEAPKGADMSKNLLVKGKVAISAILGDDNILKAMLSNEEDTNTAYERMHARVNESTNSRVSRAITQGLEDEKKHERWLRRTIEKL